MRAAPPSRRSVRAGPDRDPDRQGGDGAVREVRSTLRPRQVAADKGALGIRGAQLVFTGSTAGATSSRRSAPAPRGPSPRSRSSSTASADLLASIVANPAQAPPVAGPVGIAVAGGRRLLAARTDLHPLPGRAALGEPGPRQHPALPAARRRPDARPPPQGRLRAAAGAAGGGVRVNGPSAATTLSVERLTYLVGFVFLFGFLIWITYFDIVRQVGGERRERARTARPRRRPTPSVDVGGVLVGSAHPVVVQSMTNTDTADADATALQVAQLAQPGSQLVRVTVNNEAAAAAVPEMVRKVRDLGFDTPIVGDFHYNGHKLLVEYPEAAAALAKYRINPGNVGAKRHDENFQTIVRVAIEHDRPVRIGVNWGSLDPALLTTLMEENARLAAPRGRPRRDDRGDAPVGPPLGGAGGGDRPAPRPDHRQREGVRRPRPGRRLPAPGRPLRLPAPPRPHRGRHGDEGDRRLDGRASRSCSTRGSATRSASRSRRSRAPAAS